MPIFINLKTKEMKHARKIPSLLLFALIAYHANSHVLSVNDTIPLNDSKPVLNDSIPPANEIVSNSNSTNGWAPNEERMLINYTPTSPSAPEFMKRSSGPVN